MTLCEKQRLFTKLIAKFIPKLNDLGYEVTFGEAWRSPETCELYAKAGKGITDSLHPLRLAIDLCLFKNGEYLTQSEDYRDAGIVWESYSKPGAECCWGGRFTKPDGNHFSLRFGHRA
jgi:hypothetical protein